MTVTFTVSPSASLITMPKLICTSSLCGRLADQRAGFVHIVQAQFVGSGDVDQHAAAPLHPAFFHQRPADGLPSGFERGVLAGAVAVPIIA